MVEAAAHSLTGSRTWFERTPRVPVLVAIALAAVALCAFSIHVATNEGVPDVQVALLQWISMRGTGSRWRTPPRSSGRPSGSRGGATRR